MPKLPNETPARWSAPKLRRLPAKNALMPDQSCSGESATKTGKKNCSGV